MFEPKYLYFLKFNDQYLALINGIASLTATPTPLVFTPDGWQEVSIITERNKKYFGLDRTFTIPLNFVKDGAVLLKYITYTFGQKAQAEMIIGERKVYYDGTALPIPKYGVYYDLLFKGNADFSTFNQIRGQATSNIIEGGLASLIKTSEGITQEIDISDGQPIYMDGINLIGKQNFGMVDGFVIDTLLANQRRVFAPVALLNTEGKSTGLAFVNSNYETYTNFFDYLSTSLNYFTIADQHNTGPIDINILGQLIVKLVTKRGFSNFWLQVVRAENTQPPDYANVPGTFHVGNVWGRYYQVGSINGKGYPLAPGSDPINYGYINQGESATIPLNLNITMYPGSKLFFYLIMDNPTTGSSAGYAYSQSAWEFLAGSEFSINFTNRYAPTEALSIEGEELLKRWVLKVSGGKYTAKSDFLQANRDIVFTSGMAIRQLDNPVIKTSFLNIFNSVNTWGNVGVGIVNGVLRLEDKRFFLNAATKTLTHVANRSVSANNDLPFNSLQMGYPPVDINEINGRNEWNNTSQWSVKIPEVQKEFKVLSDYGASCYEMESLRVNLDGKDTTDANADNKTFMIHVQKDILDTEGRKLIDRSLNATATGILSASTVFNIRLSPGRCFKAWEWYIHGCFYKMDSELIKFETGDKNQLLVAGGIAENRSPYIGDLDPALFIPWDIEIDTLNPLGYTPGASEAYDFTLDNVYLAGFCMKTGIEPNTLKSQTFTLLALASVDMTKLIYSNE